MKTFTLDLRRITRNNWFCGTRACTMGQFAEQHCNINNYNPIGFKPKALEANERCNRKLGSDIVDKIVSVNDSHQSWDKKLVIIRKLFNQAGYRLVVKK